MTYLFVTLSNTLGFEETVGRKEEAFTLLKTEQ